MGGRNNESIFIFVYWLSTPQDGCKILPDFMDTLSHFLKIDGKIGLLPNIILLSSEIYVSNYSTRNSWKLKKQHCIRQYHINIYFVLVFSKQK